MLLHFFPRSGKLPSGAGARVKIQRWMNYCFIFRAKLRGGAAERGKYASWYRAKCSVLLIATVGQRYRDKLIYRNKNHQKTTIKFFDVECTARNTLADRYLQLTLLIGIIEGERRRLRPNAVLYRPWRSLQHTYPYLSSLPLIKTKSATLQLCSVALSSSEHLHRITGFSPWWV